VIGAPSAVIRAPFRRSPTFFKWLIVNVYCDGAARGDKKRRQPSGDDPNFHGDLLWLDRLDSNAASFFDSGRYASKDEMALRPAS